MMKTTNIRCSRNYKGIWSKIYLPYASGVLAESHRYINLQEEYIKDEQRHALPARLCPNLRLTLAAEV